MCRFVTVIDLKQFNFSILQLKPALFSDYFFPFSNLALRRTPMPLDCTLGFLCLQLFFVLKSPFSVPSFKGGLKRTTASGFISSTEVIIFLDLLAVDLVTGGENTYDV